MVKPKNLNFILLIPSLFLAQDFLPSWFLYTCSLQLILLTFFRIHRYFGYINFYFLWLIFDTLGKQIIPETMIPSLATLLLAQMFYNKAIARDESFLFFLWVGIFSVFSSSFSYLIYSVSILIYFFLQQSSDHSLSLRAIIKTLIDQKFQLFITAIMATVLFLFFPRFNNFLPSANYKTKGEIGYSQKVDNSNTANLELSAKVAFYAELDKVLSPEALYWRGRVHAGTDGYNWYSAKINPSKTPIHNLNNAIKTKLKFEQDFGGDVILLDHPVRITETNFRAYPISGTDEYKFYSKQKKVTLEALSIPKIFQTDIDTPRDQIYTSLPNFLPKKIKEIINFLPNDNPEQIIKQFANYLTKNGFSYSLSPGFIPTMNDFLENKKGYCTHFASLLGIILRAKNIPTRLVSGFQGGEYNDIGKFYVIKSNDAHTWVEFFFNKKWNRIDPTGFVSPARIALGGTRFLTSPLDFESTSKNQSFLMNYYNTIKLQLDNINYKVSLYFDNYDRDKQGDLSTLLKIKKQYFYLFGILLGILILLLYLYFSRHKIKIKVHPIDKILIKLDQKVKLEKKLSEQLTLWQMHEIINQSSLSDKTKLAVKNIIDSYQKVRYSKDHHDHDLFLQLSNLNIVKEKPHVKA